MKKVVLTVTLNPALDLMISNAKEVISAGGKGINVARLLRGFGVKVLATGLCGGKKGEQFQQLLRQEKFYNDFVKIDGETRVNWTCLVQKAGMVKRRIEAGPEINEKDIARFRKKFLRLVSKRGYVVFSGRNANGASDDLYAQLIKAAHQKGVRAVLDSSGIPFRKGLKSRPYLIKPNLKEAEDAVGFKLNSLLKIKKAVDRFHRFGIKQVIISLGKRGAVGSDGLDLWLARSPKLNIKNEVGCGDALLGGFLFAQLKRKSFPESLKIAVAAGSANTLSTIPCKISLKLYRRILSQVSVKKIEDKV